MGTRLRSRQAGMGVVEIVIIVAIVLIVAVLGVIGYRQLHKATAVKMPESTADSRAAQSTAQAFYAAYTDSNGQGTDIIARYGTNKLIAASKAGNKNYSPIVCAQNVAPVSTSSPVYTDGHYNVPVTLKFEQPLTFVVQVIKVGDSFKIDQVNCPEATSQGE